MILIHLSMSRIGVQGVLIPEGVVRREEVLEVKMSALQGVTIMLGVLIIGILALERR